MDLVYLHSIVVQPDSSDAVSQAPKESEKISEKMMMEQSATWANF